MDNLRSLTLSRLLNDNTPTQKINKQNVVNLVELFNKLNHNEKLLFFCSVGEGPQKSATPPLVIDDQQQNQSRLSSTQSWLLENFTSDNQTALPKEEVYDFYTKSFAKKPISTADFGKLMRQVFPEVKARRLGQRGASKYCYANIRKKSEFDVEKPNLQQIKYNLHDDYLNWAKANFGIEFDSLEGLLTYLKSNNFKNVARKRRNSSFSKNKQKEDPEIKKYFEEQQEWPHLRTLLSNEFTPITKKRHCSNTVTESTSTSTDQTFRSASVPIFDRLFLTSSRSADSGYDSVHSNTPVIVEHATNFNPLLSSVQDTTTNSDVLFDSVFDLIVESNSEEFFM